MSQISIKLRLIIILSLILVTSFVVSSVINYRVSRESIRREVLTSSLPLTSENIYSEIHTDLLKPINVSSLMANDTFLRDWSLAGEHNSELLERYLQRIQNKYGFFAAFFVSNITKNYFYPKGILKQISSDDEHDVWFFDFVKSGQEYALDVDTNEAADNKLTIFINYRLEDTKGNLLGVTGVGLEMNQMTKLLKRYQRKYDRKIYMVDEYGQIQVHINKTLIHTNAPALWQHLGTKVDEVLTPRKDPRQFEFDRDGRHILLSVKYIPEFNWFLLVEQDEAGVLSSARGNLIRSLLIGLAASLIILFISIFTVNHFQSRLEYIAATDELTGVANRREFAAQFERALHRNERYSIDFSLVMIDIDGLKLVNDKLGHLSGDMLIKNVANVILKTVRTNDVVARWGGDEFIVLVEGELAQARSAAERIRAAVEAENLPQQENLDWCDPKVTVSCGISQYRTDDTLDVATARADQAMYAIKKSGKNGVGYC